ncbi:MAG: alanine--tRNA ligase-related protein [Ignavibacteriales bacterium]|nr:alanine--tRNA ligase-related protein [Ignavibacteriales bacterium]
MSGFKYDSAPEEKRVSMRVIADHIRTLTFAIADGAVPGNDGRGYVLRRILRRAARYGRKLNLNKPFLFELVDTLVQTMGDIFPEIKEKKDYVKKVIKGEEVNFNATLDRGIDLFEDLIKGLEKDKVKIIPGEDLFMLYDTFGFPVDLTNVMARERGFTVDEEGFNELMSSQKQRARESAKDKFASVNISVGDLSLFELVSKDKPLFTGYDELKSSSKIIGHKKENGNDLVILDKTPFYVEAGGQIDDLGHLTTKNVKLPVVDVTKIDDKTVHVIENESNTLLSAGADAIAEVDESRALGYYAQSYCNSFYAFGFKKNSRNACSSSRFVCWSG